MAATEGSRPAYEMCTESGHARNLAKRSQPFQRVGCILSAGVGAHTDGAYMEELQAIRRLKNGDIGGLECLIARYQARALRTAFLITHDEALAEDIVQDVFVQ